MPIAFDPPKLTRRSSLRLAGAAMVGAVGVSALAACSSDESAEPEPPDPLVYEEELARSNATAAAAAVALAPERSAALTLIAAERTAHADALRVEIARRIGTYPDGSTPSSESTVTQTSVPAEPPVSVEQLRTQLLDAQKSTGALSRTQSDYRAGLLGSISAALAVHAGVLLR